MFSKYDIGDAVILKGTVEKIEQQPYGSISYMLKEYGVQVGEEMIVGRIEEPWALSCRKIEGTRP